MIRYVPKEFAKDVQAFVEKSCKDTGVHVDKESGRLAIATTSEKDIEKIRKKFEKEGFVL
jgi:hypothetical protein